LAIETAECVGDRLALLREQTLRAAIRATAMRRLAITPFRLRKAARNPAQRELMTLFGGTGQAAPHETVSPSRVVALAVRQAT